MTCSNLPRVSTSNYVRPGQIRSFSVFAGGICTLFCPAAGDADCHVASLLAMTCSNLPRGPIIPGYCRCTAGKRPCTRNHAPAFCMSLQNTPLQPHPRLCLLHVIANQCAHWCGNPFPRRETWQPGTTSGKFVTPYVFALGTAFCHALPQEMRIATSLRSSQ